MKFIEKTKKYFGALLKPSYQKKVISPHRDWFLILLSVAILILVVGGSSLYFFRLLKENRFFTVPEKDEVKYELHQKNLKRFLKILNDKEVRLINNTNQVLTNPFK
jgi:apolipoprotein N-acyltransferase